MNWLQGIAANVARYEIHSAASQANDETEIVAANVGGIGGAIAGIAIGSPFGLVGMAVVACIGSKVGAEGVLLGIKHLKAFIKS